MTYKLSAIYRHKFLQGGVIFTVANVLAGLINYLFNSLSAKALGPGKYSEITALFSYITIISIPIAVLSTDIIRRLGSRGNEKKQAFLLWNQWVWRTIFKYKILLIPYSLSLFILPKIMNLTFLSSLTLLLLLPGTFITAYYVAAFQGLQLFMLAAITIIVPVLVRLIGPFVAIYIGDSLSVILFFVILSGLLSIVVSSYIMDHTLRGLKIKKATIQKKVRQVLFRKELMITACSLVSVGLLNNLDIIFVKKFYESTPAGLYGAWSLFAKIIFYVFGSMIGLSLIFFSAKEYEKNHQKVLTALIIIFLLGGIFSYFAYGTLGQWLVPFMLNTQYHSIIRDLPLAALFGSFYSVLFLLNNFFLAKNSRAALIVTLALPFYAGALFLLGNTIENIYRINVYMSGLITAVYIVAIIYYNINLWKPRIPSTS